MEAGRRPADIRDRHRYVYHIDVNGVVVEARVSDSAQPREPVIHVIRLVKWG